MASAELYPHYIEFRHVYKTFDRPVLVDCSFHVDAGETVAIIGRSGVGKSVTLSHIMGFLKPDQGRVIVGYQDTTDMGEAQLLRRGEQGALQDTGAPVKAAARAKVALPAELLALAAQAPAKVPAKAVA